MSYFIPPTLADFYDSVARFYARFDHRPERFKGFEQGFSPAIAQSNPEEPYACFRLTGQVKEIFVLADDNAFLGFSVPADLNIRRFSQPDIENVLTIGAAMPEILRKSRR
ncbi:MAG TPA: hypothetical protein VJ723_08155 [Candidatus Angelobacter sp.]|nr:hypothetical protein [Candidatus Angelobacter sp.]